MDKEKKNLIEAIHNQFTNQLRRAFQMVRAKYEATDLDFLHIPAFSPVPSELNLLLRNPSTSFNVAPDDLSMLSNIDPGNNILKPNKSNKLNKSDDPDLGNNFFGFEDGGNQDMILNVMELNKGNFFQEEYVRRLNDDGNEDSEEGEVETNIQDQTMSQFREEIVGIGLQSGQENILFNSNNKNNLIGSQIIDTKKTNLGRRLTVEQKQPISQIITHNVQKLINIAPEDEGKVKELNLINKNQNGFKLGSSVNIEKIVKPVEKVKPKLKGRKFSELIQNTSIRDQTIKIIKQQQQENMLDSIIKKKQQFGKKMVNFQKLTLPKKPGIGMGGNDLIIEEEDESESESSLERDLIDEIEEEEFEEDESYDSSLRNSQIEEESVLSDDVSDHFSEGNQAVMEESLDIADMMNDTIQGEEESENQQDSEEKDEDSVEEESYREEESDLISSRNTSRMDSQLIIDIEDMEEELLNGINKDSMIKENGTNKDNSLKENGTIKEEQKTSNVFKDSKIRYDSRRGSLVNSKIQYEVFQDKINGNEGNKEFYISQIEIEDSMDKKKNNSYRDLKELEKSHIKKSSISLKSKRSEYEIDELQDIPNDYASFKKENNDTSNFASVEYYYTVSREVEEVRDVSCKATMKEQKSVQISEIKNSEIIYSNANNDVEQEGSLINNEKMSQYSYDKSIDFSEKLNDYYDNTNKVEEMYDEEVLTISKQFKRKSMGGVNQSQDIRKTMPDRNDETVQSGELTAKQKKTLSNKKSLFGQNAKRNFNKKNLKNNKSKNLDIEVIFENAEYESNSILSNYPIEQKEAVFVDSTIQERRMKFSRKSKSSFMESIKSLHTFVSVESKLAKLEKLVDSCKKKRMQLVFLILHMINYIPTEKNVIGTFSILNKVKNIKLRTNFDVLYKYCVSGARWDVLMQKFSFKFTKHKKLTLINTLKELKELKREKIKNKIQKKKRKIDKGEIKFFIICYRKLRRDKLFDTFERINREANSVKKKEREISYNSYKSKKDSFPKIKKDSISKNKGMKRKRGSLFNKNKKEIPVFYESNKNYKKEIIEKKTIKQQMDHLVNEESSKKEKGKMEKFREKNVNELNISHSSYQQTNSFNIMNSPLNFGDKRDFNIPSGPTSNNIYSQSNENKSHLMFRNNRNYDAVGRAKYLATNELSNITNQIESQLVNLRESKEGEIEGFEKSLKRNLSHVVKLFKKIEKKETKNKAMKKMNINKIVEALQLLTNGLNLHDNCFNKSNKESRKNSFDNLTTPCFKDQQKRKISFDEQNDHPNMIKENSKLDFRRKSLVLKKMLFEVDCIQKNLRSESNLSSLKGSGIQDIQRSGVQDNSPNKAPVDQFTTFFKATDNDNKLKNFIIKFFEKREQKEKKQTLKILSLHKRRCLFREDLIDNFTRAFEMKLTEVFIKLRGFRKFPGVLSMRENQKKLDSPISLSNSNSVSHKQQRSERKSKKLQIKLYRSRGVIDNRESYGSLNNSSK